jgi:hypothetical protein
MKIVKFTGMRSEEVWPITARGAASNPASAAKTISLLDTLRCRPMKSALLRELPFTDGTYSVILTC